MLRLHTAADGRSIVIHVLDGVVFFDVREDRGNPPLAVTEPPQGIAHAAVDDLQHPAEQQFCILTSAMSGSTPLSLSQSIRNAMVPVGASTVTWALR